MTTPDEPRALNTLGLHRYQTRDLITHTLTVLREIQRRRYRLLFNIDITTATLYRGTSELGVLRYTQAGDWAWFPTSPSPESFVLPLDQ